MILIGLVTTLLIIWLIYNFVWLGRSQVFLVFLEHGVPYDDSVMKKIQTATGGTFASVAQLKDATAAGASVCHFGWALCGGASECVSSNTITGAAPFNPLNVDGAGVTVPNCGENNHLNGNGMGGAYGYWMYGTRPVSSTVSAAGVTWSIAPFIDNGAFPTDKRTVFNQYEILGIPKVL